MSIRKGEDVFKLNIQYSKTNKAYIKKNDEELNDNGNIRSYEELVNEELGIEKEVMTLTRLGTNVKSFLEMEKAERKKFINNFIPDTSDFLKMHSNAKKNVLRMKERIGYLSSLLESLPNKEELLDKSNKFKKEKKILKKKIRSLTKLEIKINADFDAYEKSLDLDELKDSFNLYHLALNNYEDANNKIEGYLRAHPKMKKIDNFEELLDTKVKLVNVILNDYNIKNIERSNLDTKLIELQDDLDEKKKELKELSKENLEELKETISELESEINETEKYIKESNIYSPILEKNIKGIDLNKASIQSLQEKIEKVFDYLIEIKNSLVFGGEENLEESTNSIINTLISNRIGKENRDSSDHIISLKKEINRLIKSTSLLSDKTERYKLIKHKPKACKIDSCYFLKDIISCKGAKNKLETQEDELEANQASLSLSEALDEFFVALHGYDMEIRNSFKRMNFNNNEDLVKKLCGKKYKDVIINVNLFYKLLSGSRTKIEKAKKYLMERLEIIAELKYINERKKSLDSSKELLSSKDKQDKIRKRIKKQKKKTKEKITETKISLREIKDEIEELKTKKEKNDRVITIIKSYLELEEARDKANDSLENSKDIKDEYEKYQKRMDARSETLNIYKKEKKEYTDEYNVVEKNITTVKAKNLNRKAYKKDKKRIEQDYDTALVIRDALDPKMGLPLIFTKNFLEKTQDICNNLLDVIYDGFFRIKFEIDEKEFDIKGISHNSRFDLDDVKKGSQAEVGWLTLCISLAISFQINKGWNVLAIDELDSEFDDENRRLFLKILDKQVQLLGIEQVFIITHNDFFDSFPVDYILFKNHGISKDEIKRIKKRNQKVFFNFDDYVVE